MSSEPGRKFKPEPFETTSRSSRRFAPQPVETTSRSNRSPGLPTDPAPPRRKFAPQPVEVSHISSKSKVKDDGASPAKAKRRFAPQLVEESTSSRREATNAEDPWEASSAPPDASADSTSDLQASKRKFRPQLIETAQRTRKAGDTKPALLPSDKTDARSPHDAVPRSRRHGSRPSPPVPANTPTTSTPDTTPCLSSAEARRLGIPLPKRTLSRESLRQHSFRVPELDPIESSESEKSDSVSFSTSPSSSSDMSFRDATRRRESIDGAAYLLELAQEAAERQLREQALAAFPNDDRHTPVDHFIGRDSDENAAAIGAFTLGLDRRDSGFTKTDVQYLEMRRHQERREAEREKERQAREARKRRMMAQQSTSREHFSPWQQPLAAIVGQGIDFLEPDNSKDEEIARMRARARPPMLGKDLKFPRCESPEPARFDVTQGSWSARHAMCYLTEQAGENLRPEGLWSPIEGKDTVHSGRSGASSRASSRGGLWGGFCKEGDTPLGIIGPTGIMTPRPMTPRHEVEESFEPVTEPEPLKPPPASLLLRELPPSPPQSWDSGIGSLDEKLEAEMDKEKTIEQEFSDGFVTQVYNYLSLGYPSLARRYDDELAKISGIPICDLRRDDDLPSARGYIRFGEDEEEGGNAGVREVDCWRWQALRLYVREWARQQPRFLKREDVMGGFGVAVRRGSWAW
jgi:hypothetical protein